MTSKSKKTGGSSAQTAGIAAVAVGVEDLQAAGQVAALSRAALASGESNLARGADAVAVAQGIAELSQVVGMAGEADLAQGVDALAAAQKLEIGSDVVSALSSEDLERAMELGSISGQISVASEIVYGLQLPELAAFLRAKSDRLHAIAVDAVYRFGATRALSAAMAETSNQIGALGANEMREGFARREAAQAAQAASVEMTEAGLALQAQGDAELYIAGELHNAALGLVVDGVAGVANGAKEMGTATQA